MKYRATIIKRNFNLNIFRHSFNIQTHRSSAITPNVFDIRFIAVRAQDISCFIIKGFTNFRFHFWLSFKKLIQNALTNLSDNHRPFFFSTMCEF